MITIIDYGMGNLGSIANMLKKIGVESLITSDVKLISDAGKIILPGVGSYARAMENLYNLDLVSVIRKKAEEGTPLLGICLGMQLLSTHSEEGNANGLNIVPGRVIKFHLPEEYKVPHMGWNLIKYNKTSPLFKNFSNLEEVRYYFVHSYHFQPENKSYELATAAYGLEFTCGIQNKNVFGVQFHPEKSHRFGMELLKNFSDL